MLEAFLLLPGWVKGALIAGVSSLVLGGTLGYRLEKAFSDARWANAKTVSQQHTIAVLQDRARVINDAANDDAARATQAQIALEKTKEQRDALAQQIADGPCLDDAATGRLRQFWGLGAPAVPETGPHSHR
jgi:hypothetical protein